MLDHLDLEALAGKDRPSRRIDSLTDGGSDANGRLDIVTDKRDPGAGRGRSKLNPHIAAAPIAEACHGSWYSDRTLFPRALHRYLRN
jgi:hypothetical protein